MGEWRCGRTEAGRTRGMVWGLGDGLCNRGRDGREHLVGGQGWDGCGQDMGRPFRGDGTPVGCRDAGGLPAGSFLQVVVMREGISGG